MIEAGLADLHKAGPETWLTAGHGQYVTVHEALLWTNGRNGGRRISKQDGAYSGRGHWVRRDGIVKGYRDHAMPKPCPPPPARVWVGGVLYDVTVWLGVEGPGPPASVLVRPLVWLMTSPTPNLDAEGPGTARRRAVPVGRADERPAFARWAGEVVP
jgi:hypothetical protein